MVSVIYNMFLRTLAEYINLLNWKSFRSFLQTKKDVRNTLIKTKIYSNSLADNIILLKKMMELAQRIADVIDVLILTPKYQEQELVFIENVSFHFKSHKKILFDQMDHQQ